MCVCNKYKRKKLSFASLFNLALKIVWLQWIVCYICGVWYESFILLSLSSLIMITFLSYFLLLTEAIFQIKCKMNERQDEHMLFKSQKFFFIILITINYVINWMLKKIEFASWSHISISNFPDRTNNNNNSNGIKKVLCNKRQLASKRQRERERKRYNF